MKKDNTVFVHCAFHVWEKKAFVGTQILYVSIYAVSVTLLENRVSRDLNKDKTDM